MLDRAKLLRELQHLSGNLFADLSGEFNIARTSWERICNDSTFIYKIQELQTQLSLPTWNGSLEETHPIAEPIDQYCVIAIDGSQIYPDKHQGTSCFLINVGSVILSYGLSGKSVLLDTAPYVFLGDEEKEIEHVSPDYVNLRREQFEFEAGYELAQQQKASIHPAPLLVLWDGSLIFWYLESKDPTLRTLFLSRYFNTLMDMYNATIINAAYISLPKNKELVNLLKVELTDGNLDNTQACECIKHLLDVHLVHFFLKPGMRTTIFKHHSKTADYYPEPLKPYFFYINTGFEIARIELPAWIARNDEAISLIVRAAYDQSIKGRGYPIALAEAHEQAVVKGPDREFFYHLITKLGIHQKKQTSLSHKMLKKRSIGI